MRKKIYDILNKIYGIILMTSFFAGILPLIAFAMAIIIGGETGEVISVFLYEKFYPWVIVCSAVSVLIGWVASYIYPEKKVPSENKTEKQS